MQLDEIDFILIRLMSLRKEYTATELAKIIFSPKDLYDLRNKDSLIRNRAMKLLKYGIITRVQKNGISYWDISSRIFRKVKIIVNGRSHFFMGIVIQSGNDFIIHGINESEIYNPKIKSLSEETKRKMRLHHADVLGKRNPMYGRINRPMLGKHFSEETKNKISLANRGRNFNHNEETKRKISEKARERWQNPEFVRKMIKAIRMKPTKPEKITNEILQKYLPNTYAYNGDFSQGITIGGLIPDFVNVNGEKKAIEVFGDYWHRNDNPQERIEHFAKYGWKLIVIWEYELKILSEQEIINKVTNETL